MNAATDERALGIQRPKWRLDPELAAINVLIPRLDLNDLVSARRCEMELVSQTREPTGGVTSFDYWVPGRDGHAIAIRAYRPIEATGPLPCLVFIHGGAFMLGGLHTEEERCERYAVQAHCVVVGLDYRLAPEHPFPAALHDCLDVAVWVADNAMNLEIDPSRLAVGGNSAGGALAAAAALECRVTPYPVLVHQLLINPVLDVRANSHSAMLFTDTPLWTRADTLLMWSMYLPEGSTAADTRAAPALSDSVEGVAGASIWVAEYDPLRDEGLAYAERLMRAGVSVGLCQYPGTFHGFDSYRMTKVGQRALDDQVRSLRTAFSV